MGTGTPRGWSLGGEGRAAKPQLKELMQSYAHGLRPKNSSSGMSRGGPARTHARHIYVGAVDGKQLKRRRAPNARR